jgi:uncharacterized protein YueI
VFKTTLEFSKPPPYMKVLAQNEISFAAITRASLASDWASIGSEDKPPDLSDYLINFAFKCGIIGNQCFFAAVVIRCSVL